jgi:hypothetical protein
MAATIVGARPIEPRKIAVAGEIGDATRIVVGLAEGALRLAGKEPRKVSSSELFFE